MTNSFRSLQDGAAWAAANAASQQVAYQASAAAQTAQAAAASKYQQAAQVTQAAQAAQSAAFSESAQAAKAAKAVQAAEAAKQWAVQQARNLAQAQAAAEAQAAQAGQTLWAAQAAYNNQATMAWQAQQAAHAQQSVSLNDLDSCTERLACRHFAARRRRARPGCEAVRLRCCRWRGAQAAATEVAAAILLLGSSDWQESLTAKISDGKQPEAHIYRSHPPAWPLLAPSPM
ncbi:tol-Pal system protein TolA-like [Penaeus japonicus]|uniref:tol-Pal system protein TolA-like n=1 Tax=Penaeus japonicus TaxID=27405 RepID=UPI001C717621|nr:tol-Pal system protein TolA-like [Penaeus japonicus]